MIHELKTWPAYFVMVKDGIKTFELRKNDRNFELRDTLKLREWLPDKKKYTGSYIIADIRYILRDADEFGLKRGYVILGIVFLTSITKD